MPVDGYATQAQYLDHIAPILLGLPEERRGVVYVELNYNELAPHARELGIRIAPHRPPGANADPDPVLVAGGADLQAAWAGRPIVFIEHGAGQTYEALDVATYSGGAGRDQVALFLCPRQEVCDRNLARYPNAEAVAVGDPTIRPDGPFEPTNPPTVAFSWHWDFASVPEARTTWPYWADGVLALPDRWKRRPEWAQFRILGHAHPKIQHKIMPWWEQHGIEATGSWQDVVRRASLFVCDNSSCLYEFAALDRPVLVLDAPSYRRDVEHGLRFWEHADVGLRIGRPNDLGEAIAECLDDLRPRRARRQQIVSQVYAAVGEQAQRLAVHAIMSRWQ